MTIAGILRRHGHDVERLVSATGKLIFRTPGVAVPAVAMALKSHTFHGGENPIDQGDHSNASWWLDEAAMDRDRVAMAAHFPEFTEMAAEEGRPPAWFGTIDTGRGVFPILIQHRIDHGLPHVVPLSPAHRSRHRGRGTVKSPHLYLNGDLCVADQEDWDPEVDTAAVVVGWAAHWHAAYVEWLYTDRWPTESYQRNVA